MKKFKKLSSVMLAVCLFLCACSVNGGNSETNSAVLSSLKNMPVLVGDIPCDFPLVKDKTTLNYLVSGYGNVNSEDVYVWKKYEEMTNVNINWTTVSKSERAEQVYNALINKKQLDLIMRCKISSERLLNYGESGLILDLAKDDLLKNNAPNCWAYLQSHPDTLASVMNPDGTIYALPQVNSGAELRVSRKVFINKKWLENVNMEIPKTTEEFYLLLKAFKEQDANGNGDPNDEIPLCSQDWLSLQEAFFGAFGLADRGIHNQTVDYDEKSGQLRFIAASDGYKTFLEYFNRLYSEELLDKYTFTMTTEQWVNNANNDRIGAFSSTNLATLPSDKMNDWVAVDEALEGPDGDKFWSAIRANFHSTGAALIPTTCKNPELVLKWLDYFWTDEGTLFYHMGVENETFVKRDDGTFDYLPSIYDEMRQENKSFDDVIATYSPYPGGGNPTVEIAPYFMGGEMSPIPAEAARRLFKYEPEEYWPSFIFTAEENSRISVAQSDINKYCSAAKEDFITGVKPFSEWDDYTAQLEKLGEKEVLEVYQAAVDRYYQLTGKQKT